MQGLALSVFSRYARRCSHGNVLSASTRFPNDFSQESGLSRTGFTSYEKALAFPYKFYSF